MPWIKQAIGIMLIPTLAALMALGAYIHKIDSSVDKLAEHETRIQILERENTRLRTLIAGDK